jgi:hypothetical protein
VPHSNSDFTLSMKGAQMNARTVFGTLAVTCMFALPVFAGGTDNLQRYFSDAATKAKEAATPAEKRLILDNSFRVVSNALDIAASMPFTSKHDLAAIEKFKSTLRDKQDELRGTNGFTRVPDTQLNAFSGYIVQDMEQADQTVTISVVTLLIILLVILILV